MSEAPTPANQTPTPGPGAEAAQQKPEPQDTTDWKAEARKWEARSKDNNKAQAELDKLTQANLSETERLAADKAKADEDAKSWQGKFTALAKTNAIQTAATAANATDPETVALYLDSAVTIDADGKPEGIDKAMKDLQVRKPHLFRTAPEGARDIFGQQKTPPGLNEDGLTSALRRAVGA